MKPFPEIPGVKLFLAGGFIRDHLLGLPSHDRDFVALTKLSFKELVDEVNKIGKVFQAKEEFLTIRCQINKEVLDIAMPRSENNYTDGRHPEEVTRVATLEEDSSRRDFTINAMYMGEKGEIIDYHGGQRDLTRKILRTVGSPSDRFKEDYLRIIRAIRFSIKYKLKITQESQNYMRRYIKQLTNISFERIKDELNKCFLIDPILTFDAIDCYRLWDVLEQKGLWFKLTSEKRPKKI